MSFEGMIPPAFLDSKSVESLVRKAHMARKTYFLGAYEAWEQTIIDAIASIQIHAPDLVCEVERAMGPHLRTQATKVDQVVHKLRPMGVFRRSKGVVVSHAIATPVTPTPRVSIPPSPVTSSACSSASSSVPSSPGIPLVVETHFRIDSTGSMPVTTSSATLVSSASSSMPSTPLFPVHSASSSFSELPPLDALPDLSSVNSSPSVSASPPSTHAKSSSMPVGEIKRQSTIGNFRRQSSLYTVRRTKSTKRLTTTKPEPVLVPANRPKIFQDFVQVEKAVFSAVITKYEFPTIYKALFKKNERVCVELLLQYYVLTVLGSQAYEKVLETFMAVKKNKKLMLRVIRKIVHNTTNPKMKKITIPELPQGNLQVAGNIYLTQVNNLRKICAEFVQLRYTFPAQFYNPHNHAMGISEELREGALFIEEVFLVLTSCGKVTWDCADSRASRVKSCIREYQMVQRARMVLGHPNPLPLAGLEAAARHVFEVDLTVDASPGPFSHEQTEAANKELQEILEDPFLHVPFLKDYLCRRVAKFRSRSRLQGQMLLIKTAPLDQIFTCGTLRVLCQSEHDLQNVQTFKAFMQRLIPRVAYTHPDLQTREGILALAEKARGSSPDSKATKDIIGTKLLALARVLREHPEISYLDGLAMFFHAEKLQRLFAGTAGESLANFEKCLCEIDALQK